MIAAVPVLLVVMSGNCLSQVLKGSRQGAVSPGTNLSPSELRARLAPLVQRQSLGNRVENPQAELAESAIIAVFRRQQQAAETEKFQILGTRAGSTAPLKGPGPIGAGTIQSARMAGPRTSPIATNAGITSGSLMNRMGSAANLHTAICPPNARPAIRTVDGEASGVIFTPDAPGSGSSKQLLTSPKQSNGAVMNQGFPTTFYTIEGCGFGTVPGQASLIGTFKQGALNLVVDTWTDTGIIVHVPQTLSGELDQDDVTLALTISGMRVQATGFKFRAARQEVELVSIPRSEATLAGPNLRPNFPFYQSPGFGTVDVQRPAGESFNPGTDYYSFDKLQRGFVPTAFQASPYAPLTAEQCDYMLNYLDMNINFIGTWYAGWEGNRLRIDWRVSHCSAPAITSKVPYNSWAAWYGAKIWVTGPRGVSPWPANMQ